MAFVYGLLCTLLFIPPLAASPSGSEARDRDALLEQLRAGLQNKAYGDALIVLDRLLESEPNNYQLHNLRGVAKDRMGRFSEATPSYLKALQLQPASVTVGLNLALNYLRLGKDGEAAREFAVLVEQDRSSTSPPPNPYQQAPAGAELGTFARSLKPEETQYFSLARLFLRHGLPEAAMTVLSVGTQSLPQSSLLHYSLGWSLQEMGRFREAEQSYRRALALKSDYFECCLRLGYSYMALSQFEEAAATYRDCVRMSPENYAGHYYLATALMKGKTPAIAEAVANLEQAVKLNPYSHDARLQLGKAYAAEGADSKALREFSIVAREDPENAEAHYRLGMLYKKLDQSEEARKHLERFETLKAREIARMKDRILSGPVGLPQSALGEIADAVVAFYARYKEALTKGRYEEIWEMLTEQSKALYHDDPNRFRETLSHLDPALLDRIKRSSISGGKLVSGRIVCEVQPVDGMTFPPLVLIQDGDKVRMDYAFDLSLAGLAYLGAKKPR